MSTTSRQQTGIILLVGATMFSVGVCEAVAALGGFVETFSGQGRYESFGGEFGGLDNPGWDIYGNGEITASGYVFANLGVDNEASENEWLTRPLSGTGSFHERIEVRNLELGEVEFMGTFRWGVFSVVHRLADGRGNQIGFAVSEDETVEGDVWRLGAVAGTSQVVQEVPRGRDVSFEFAFDVLSRTLTFSYDVDIDDDQPALLFEPLDYSGTFEEQGHYVRMAIGASGTGARADGTLTRWEVLPVPGIAGDFNGNGILDAADIDLLSAQIRAGSTDLLYDLNEDSIVDDLDHQFWVHDLKQTFFGDADLNGTFDSTDLVQVLGSGQYEDNVELNSTWLTGDWNGDSEFTSGDLVVALADGEYEAGAVAVPEPAGVALAMTIAAFVVIRRGDCVKTRRA